MSLNNTIYNCFKQDLKNHILNKLSYITVKLSNFYQFIKLCNNINRY